MADHFSILDYVVDATYLEYANNVAIYGNYAYVGSRSGSGNAVGKYVTILNISDPTNISIVGNIPTDSACGNVKIIDNYLCCMWYTGRLKIFDLSIDPTNPTLLYTKSSGYELGGLCVFHENGDAHVLTANGLYNIDDDCSLVNSLAISGVRQIIRDHRSEYRKYFYCVCSGLAVGYNTYCNIVKWDYDLNTLTSVYSRYINTDSNGFAIAQGYGENSRYVYTDSWSSDSTIYTIDVQNPETSSWTITSVTGGNGSSQVITMATDPNHPNVLYVAYGNLNRINKYYITSGSTISFAYSITDATKLNNLQTIDIIDGLLYVGGDGRFAIVQDVMADPLPPINPISTPSAKKNTITFEPGPPNEYFDGDLSNWTNYSYTGNGSTSIVSGKLRINLENEDDYVLSTYKYSISPGDFIINIDIPAYEPNSNSIHTYLYLTEGDFQLPWNENNYVRILYNHEVVSGDYVTSRLRVNGDNQDEIITDAGSRPTKFKVTRIGTVISTYYYINSWVLLDSRDFGNFANTITTVVLAVSDYNNNGGYVEFDDLVIISENYYFPNDLFNNLNNWQNYCVNGGTAAISLGKVLLDVPNGVDAYARLWNKYSLSSGNFSISIDVSDYTPDDIDNGLGALVTISSSTTNNYATIKITQDGVDNFDLRFIYNINDAGAVTSSATYLTNVPSKFRFDRIGTLIKAYYYDGSWHEYGSQDFGSYSSEINQYYLEAQDGGPLYGGSVKFDNLILDKGVSAYNLYWKKDKCPNCYFNNIDDWTIEDTAEAGENVTEENERLRLTLPNTGNSLIRTVYNYTLSSINYTVDIDMPTYEPYNATGFYINFRLSDVSPSASANDRVRIRYNYDNGNHEVLFLWKIDDIEYNNGDVIVASTPTKFRFVRSGSTITAYYYITGWVEIDNVDMGSEINNLIYIKLDAQDNGNYGGYVEFDNLIITPSVKDDYDGVINDIVDLNYDHTSLIPGDVYCYELTAQGSESEPSEETFGVPLSSLVGIDSSCVITTTISSEQLIVGLVEALSSVNIVISDTTSELIVGKIEEVSAVCNIVSDSTSYLSTSPPIPENVTVTVSGVYTLLVDWDAVLDATSYNVYWDTTSGGPYNNKISGITNSYYEITLVPGIMYYFVVTSENWVGESGYSLEVSASLSRYSEFTYAPLPSDLSSILSGLISAGGDPISYEALTSRPTSRSDRRDKLNELADYFSETLPLHFLYDSSSTITQLLTEISPDLKSSIDSYFSTGEGDVALSNLLRTMDDWIQDDDNVGSNAPVIEIVLRGLGFSEQQALLELVNFFKPYRSRLVFIGSTFSIDNILTESLIMDDSFNQYMELTFGYDYINNNDPPCDNPRVDETITLNREGEPTIHTNSLGEPIDSTSTEFYEIVDDIDEIYNHHMSDSTTGHYENWEFTDSTSTIILEDSTSEIIIDNISSLIVSDGFYDWDDPNSYFDEQFGCDIVTIIVS